MTLSFSPRRKQLQHAPRGSDRVVLEDVMSVGALKEQACSLARGIPCSSFLQMYYCKYQTQKVCKSQVQRGICHDGVTYEIIYETRNLYDGKLNQLLIPAIPEILS